MRQAQTPAQEPLDHGDSTDDGLRVNHTKRERAQLPIKLWHGQFQDPTLADAILDRLVHNAQIIELTGESMRKQSAPTRLVKEDKPNTKI